MKIIEENKNETVLRGFGTDLMGASFAYYGLTLHKRDNDVNKVTLHIYNRKIEIVYVKAKKKQANTLNQYSDFDNFKNFTHKWNTSMLTQEKLHIVLQTDKMHNHGADACDNNDLTTAIYYFEQALEIMPNNDDSVKSLKVCYRRIGNQQKFEEMEKKLNYLGQNTTSI